MEILGVDAEEDVSVDDDWDGTGGTMDNDGGFILLRNEVEALVEWLPWNVVSSKSQQGGK